MSSGVAFGGMWVLGRGELGLGVNHLVVGNESRVTGPYPAPHTRCPMVHPHTANPKPQTPPQRPLFTRTTWVVLSVPPAPLTISVS